jgi:hypothetical protein
MLRPSSSGTLPSHVTFVAYIDESGDTGLETVKKPDPRGATESLILSAFVVKMTEVWAYNSGNWTTGTDASYGRFGGTAISSSRFCNINVVMNKGQVATVNYTGPTGGLLTASEQCAYAIGASVRHQ